MSIHHLTRGLHLTWAAFREQARAERAYLGNFWFGMLSKAVYNTMFILFIDQLYARVGQIAGYSKNDFLFLYLVSQVGFYICYYGIFYALQRLVQIVRNGNFDLLLLKPVPHRSFLYIQGLQPYELILTAVPSIVVLIAMINWSALQLSAGSVALGLIVWISGILICNTIMFALSLPVFKSGEATDTNNIFYSISSVGQMPFSRLPLFMKTVALGICPQIIIAGAASEILLSKIENPLSEVALIASVAIVAVVIVNTLWRYALRNYTSVSS